jgi:hypothetical protein
VKAKDVGGKVEVIDGACCEEWNVVLYNGASKAPRGIRTIVVFGGRNYSRVRR